VIKCVERIRRTGANPPNRATNTNGNRAPRITQKKTRGDKKKTKGSAKMGLPKNKQTDALFSSVLLLESVEDCYRYFEDLCTIQEIRDLGQRLEIAKALDAGDTYQSAIEKTGVSTATIGRVKRCLNYGAGGYRLILDRMKAEEKRT
jgi:TrpR-related protein YerC/YecD